jgi:RHS repeat-associated protein
MVNGRQFGRLVWLLALLALVLLHSVQANGNVTAAGGKSFSYDSQNELVAMTGGGTTFAAMYDAFGNRVAKSVVANGTTTSTLYLVDDLNPTGYPQVVEELNGSGVVTRTYTYGLQRIDEEQVLNGTWTPSFYGYDGGGNARQLTNTAGTVTDQYEYDAFGNELTITGGGSTPNNFLYRGEQWDPDLGLYYLRARYYNPLTGRFMSRDPNDPQLFTSGYPTDPTYLHKYLYAGGDAINAADPNGRDFVEFASTVIPIALTVAGLYKYGRCIVNVLEQLTKDLSLGFQGYSYVWPRWQCFASAWWGMNSPYPIPGS